MHIFSFFILNLFFDDWHALMDICDDRFQRPPGALPSSMLGYEALTGSLDDFGFEDYLNSKTFYPSCCFACSFKHFAIAYDHFVSILSQIWGTLVYFMFFNLDSRLVAVVSLFLGKLSQTMLIDVIWLEIRSC